MMIMMMMMTMTILMRIMMMILKKMTMMSKYYVDVIDIDSVNSSDHTYREDSVECEYRQPVVLAAVDEEPK